MKLSMRNKFLFLSILLFVCGTGISGGISSWKARTALQDQIARQLIQIADVTVKLISGSLESVERKLATWSEDMMLQTVVEDLLGETVIDAADEMLNKIKDENEYIEGIAVANVRGEVVVGPSVYKPLTSIADKDFFKAAVAGESFVTDVMKNEETGKPFVVCAYPLKSGLDIFGILFAELPIEYFDRNFLGAAQIGEEGYAFMYSRNLTVVAHPDETLVMTLNVGDQEFGQQAKEGGRTVLTCNWLGQARFIAQRRIERTGWTVAITATRSEVLAPVTSLSMVNGMVGVGVIVVGTLLMLWLVRSIITPLNAITLGLTQVSEEVFSASVRVASASQSVAHDSSVQASSLKESSSSLQVASQMTKSSAENAGQVNLLVKENSKVVGQATGSMTDLAGSMAEISQASGETQKIVQTIDEIAFQTNLLALNAAVEAARAGEAGAGFSVVAQEVRNLAMRAAEAARNTANLIDGTIAKIQTGSQLVTETSSAFSEVARSVSKIDELVVQISSGSREQAQQIEQINLAVANMGRIVQQNAENAEESATASEQMQGQAERMKAFVENLVTLVQGGDALS